MYRPKAERKMKVSSKSVTMGVPLFFISGIDSRLAEAHKTLDLRSQRWQLIGSSFGNTEVHRQQRSPLAPTLHKKQPFKVGIKPESNRNIVRPYRSKHDVKVNRVKQQVLHVYVTERSCRLNLCLQLELEMELVCKNTS